MAARALVTAFIVCRASKLTKLGGGYCSGYNCNSTSIRRPFDSSLHCALAAAQCIVIGPVCGFVCGFVCVCVCVFVCLWVCYHDNSKLRASILTKLGLVRIIASILTKLGL